MTPDTQPGFRIAPRLGPSLLVGVAIAYPVFWLLARPSGQPTGRYLGELCGAEAVRRTATLCGPPAMTAALSKGFRSLGIAPARVRWEQFGSR
jgi:hypothetical protein